MRFMITLELNTAGAFGHAVAAHLDQLFSSLRRWSKVFPKRLLTAATITCATSSVVSASALIINPGISAAMSVVMVSEEHTFLCVGGSASSRLSLIVEPLLVTVVLNLHLVYFVFEFFFTTASSGPLPSSSSLLRIFNLSLRRRDWRCKIASPTLSSARYLGIHSLAASAH